MRRDPTDHAAVATAAAARPVNDPEVHHTLLLLVVARGAMSGSMIAGVIPFARAYFTQHLGPDRDAALDTLPVAGGAKPKCNDDFHVNPRQRTAVARAAATPADQVQLGKDAPFDPRDRRPA
ncbi:MAG TPA: hypothetical protein VKX16_07295 [Chloroflexota bacterium]|nr:hypothetical protein [Chloroflexota bacterium]